MAGYKKREGIMLAFPADDKRISGMPMIPNKNGKNERKMFHQPKLNGERCRIEWFGSVPYLISSYGNQFKFMEHIQNEITVLSSAIGQEKLDGEIYVHGWSRERIDSALRRKTNKSDETYLLEYHIFDYQNYTQYQYERLKQLGTIDQLINTFGLKHLKVVPYGICSDLDWIHHCSCYCEEAYEGIILRNPFSRYEDKRVPGLLKFKPTETDEYEIVKVNEATTSDTNEPKGMVGSFTVRAKDEPADVTFDVGAGKLKHDKRIAYWKMRDQLTGKMLIVKHELLRTTNQVPIACVAVDLKQPVQMSIFDVSGNVN